MLGFGAQIVAGRHRETVGEEVRKTESQDDPLRELRTRDAADDRESRYRSLDAAVDPITKIVMCWSTIESSRSCRTNTIRSDSLITAGPLLIKGKSLIPGKALPQKCFSHSHPALAGCVRKQVLTNRFNGFPNETVETVPRLYTCCRTGLKPGENERTFEASKPRLKICSDLSGWMSYRALVHHHRYAS